MKAFKFFNKDLTCTAGSGTFQFEIGKTYTEKEANCVKNGFHCCEYVLDCLNYYDLITSRYCIVEAAGDLDEDGTDTKISCTEITLLKELNLYEITYYAAAYIIDHLKNNKIYKHTASVEVADDVTEGEYISIAIGEHPRVSTVKPGVIGLIRVKDGEVLDAKVGISYPGMEYMLDGEGMIHSEEKENTEAAD